MNITKLVGIGSVLITSHWALAQDPRISKQPTNATVSLGATVQFLVLANTAHGPLTYQWHFKDAPLDAMANPSVATRTLSLTNVTLAQDGPYFVMVSNALGPSTNSDHATLTVDPTFTKITTGPPVTDLGSSVVALLQDEDNDGFDDLVVLRGGKGMNALYRSTGDGTFTSPPYLPWSGNNTLLGAWADLDSDGHLDLVFGAFRKPSWAYFKNSDGTWSHSPLASSSDGVAGLVDFDQDGLLDVSESLIQIQGGGTTRLYRNLGNRTFIRMTSDDVGPLLDFKTSYGLVAWADYDDDGWVDVCIGNISGPGRLYHNEGAGWFVEVPDQVTKLWQSGDWGDYDNDGKVDLCGPQHNAPPLWNASTAAYLYRNLGGGEFEELSLDDTNPGPHGGAAWADYDNDGFLDLFLGAYIPENTSGRNSLYHNNGDGTFSRITTGSIVTDVPVGGSGTYAGLWFDYDNDGFLDLYAINGDNADSIWTANFLYHNNGNANAWLKVKLVGTASNRDGIGAKVRVQAKYAGQVRWQRRDISAGGIWCGNRPYAHFGLGDATIVDLVRIEWPSGLVQEFKDVAVKQTLKVTEQQESPPTTAPTLTATRSTEGAVQLTLTGQTDLLYVFQASTNLVQWTKLGVRTNLTGTVEFTDTWATKYAQRFYRGVAP